jgi:hypothetical protein
MSFRLVVSNKHFMLSVIMLSVLMLSVMAPNLYNLLYTDRGEAVVMLYLISTINLKPTVQN